MWLRGGVLGLLVAGSVSILAAQAPAPGPGGGAAGWRKVEDSQPAPESQPKAPETQPDRYVVAAGTRIPLSLINSVSTKHSAEGDRVYLQTVFPILVHNRVVIPPGSYVEGTVTEVKRPGRVKGRGELYLRFDSLTLPNGVTRSFRGRIGGLDGLSNDELLKSEGKVKSPGDKAGDARTVGEAAGAGASVGTIAGAAAGRPGMGLGIGSAAGAAAGLMAVLLTRGPDAVLERGSTLEMVLDRDVTFEPDELDFSHAMPSMPVAPPPPQQTEKRRGLPLPGLGWPY
jgi:hypothetical protein